MCRNSDLTDHITVISRATGKVHERMKTTAAQEVWPPKICTQVAQNAVLEIPLALHAATHHPPIILSFLEPTWSSHRGTSARSLSRKEVHSHNHYQRETARSKFSSAKKTFPISIGQVEMYSSPVIHYICNS